MRLLVFTDLDGTLLEHGSYSYAAAQPALTALAARNVPLILASSKTAAEIAPLHRELGLGDWPALVENGAGVYDPRHDTARDSIDYLSVRQALKALPASLRRHFQGFWDMGDAGVQAATGLSAQQAALARRRCYSEPGLWSGSEAELKQFLSGLAAQGVAARRGGRFLTLSLGRTKADGMAEIMARFLPERTLALGDAPNDIEMLETADHGVCIRNDHAPPLPPLKGEAEGHITRTTRPGPEGWSGAVLNFLDTYAQQ